VQTADSLVGLQAIYSEVTILKNVKVGLKKLRLLIITGVKWWLAGNTV